jgi:hypothetical protein
MEVRRARSCFVVATIVLILLATACGSGGGSSKYNLSVAYKLAVIDGDASEESDFQDVIDCIMASGIKGAETEQKVGDTLVASWKASSQQDSLVEWGQALCNG